MQATELVGLDIGQKRTGIARASSIARLAEPLATVETQHIIPKLKELIGKLNPEVVVVGLPRNLQGDDTEQTKWVRNFTDSLIKQFPLVEFKFQDEALTTVAAAEHPAKNPTEIDAVAASIILQDYLNDETAKQGSHAVA